MADLSDIEKALATRLAAVLFTGTYQPGASASSTAGMAVKLYRGWPVANVLDADLRAGTCHVSVFPVPNMTRDATRYRPEWGVLKTVEPTLTATVFGAKVTFAGTGGAGQVASLAGPGQAETYRLGVSDTPASVAAELGGRFPGATVAGAVVTMPTDAVSAGVVADQVALREVRRQAQGIKVMVWADTPANRDALAGAVDLALATIPNGDGISEFITLPNGETARVQYRGGFTDDKVAKDRLWRRDLNYAVEFATTQTEAQASVAVAATAVRAGGVSSGTSFRDAQLIGAIRYDAWYSGDALTLAEAAALSPSQFNARAPFFATVSGGVTLDGNHQAVMDAECASAVAAKLDFWAFLGWPTGSAELNARNLYLASTVTKPRFCLIENFANLGYQGALQPEFWDAVTLAGHASYQRVMGRPLMFFLANSDADMATRYGGTSGFATVIALMRSKIKAAVGADPYFVVQDASPNRAARLARECGFDAIGTYALSGGVQSPTAYSALASRTAAAWDEFAGFGLDAVPLAMTGWNATPRAVTPNAYFGAEVNGSLQAYYQDGAASDIAAHVAGMRDWMRRNLAASPMQAGLVYAWNEFTEGGWLCPTYLSGQPAWDNSRVAALGAALT